MQPYPCTVQFPHTLRVVCCVLPILLVPAAVTQWTNPTAAELQMTSEPKAPGAPAIILSYDETGYSWTPEITIHVRIKVLTSGGITAGTIEIPGNIAHNDDFVARTIHSDGSIVPFVRDPRNPVTPTTESGANRKFISLPSVEAGSIIEYRCHFASPNMAYTYIWGASSYAPTWQIQQAYFVRAAHYNLTITGDLRPKATRWVANLPPGAAIKREDAHVTLDLTDIPAAAAEDFMPPPNSVLYNVRFFYQEYERDNYWGVTGASADDRWKVYDTPSKVLVAVANSLTLPTDNSDAKLRKIYAAVEALENTDFTRRHSKDEDKAANLNLDKNSEGIWNRKRGNSWELTHLFVALARAAGFKAYPMEVASRGHDVFDQNVLSWSQLDSMIAIVVVADKELYFDPGTPFCAYGDLATTHSHVIGVSTEAKLVKIRSTPTVPVAASLTERKADLTLSPTGEVTGKIQIAWSRNAAFLPRAAGLLGDALDVETGIERALQSVLPSGLEVHLESLNGLADGEVALIAKFSVSGKLGVATARRLIVPAQIFASTAKPILSSETRTLPVSFPEAFEIRDQTVFHLPAQLSAEPLPQPANLSIGNRTAYASEAAVSSKDPHILLSQRIFVLKEVDYKLEDYPALHKYFGQVATFDQNQISLQIAPAAAVPAGDH